MKTKINRDKYIPRVPHTVVKHLCLANSGMTLLLSRINTQRNKEPKGLDYKAETKIPNP